ncbi:MAG: hypothetical protein ACHREM_22460 [Polyangiales bacterium]
MNRFLRAVAFALVVSACGTTLAYVPQPERITNPAEELKTLIVAADRNGCNSMPSIVERDLTIMFDCPARDPKLMKSAMKPLALNFDQISAIDLRQSGEWYTVYVHNKSGQPKDDLSWSSKKLEDMQHMVDCLTALWKAGGK